MRVNELFIEKFIAFARAKAPPDSMGRFWRAPPNISRGREKGKLESAKSVCLQRSVCVCVFTAFLPARNKKSHSRQHARTLRRLMIFKRLFLLYDSALAPATRTRHLLLCLHGRHATCCLCKFHVVLSKRDTMITDLFLLGALRR